VRQDTAMSGSLTVRGRVIPVGGVTAKIEAAAEAGIKRVLIPYQNIDDVKLEEKYDGKIEIIPVKTFTEVLREVFPKEYGNIADKFAEIEEESILNK
ncbi:MAG: ATP-dependent protease LonB, partial [Candidatus Heimdallarchaeota archaeon]|nr:ATP-dependent protease LonB [Candidatus Heimdallarchaeota archaeon]